MSEAGLSSYTKCHMFRAAEAYSSLIEWNRVCSTDWRNASVTDLSTCDRPWCTQKLKYSLSCPLKKDCQPCRGFSSFLCIHLVSKNFTNLLIKTDGFPLEHFGFYFIFIFCILDFMCMQLCHLVTISFIFFGSNIHNFISFFFFL